MGLFGNKRKELPSLFSEPELEAQPVVDYNSVIDYLTGLSDEDYTKVCKVAEIYRIAQAEAADALGMPNEPSTFITQPELPENTELVPHDVNHIKPKTLLDDDDDDADIAAILDDDPGFIEDAVPTAKKRNGKAVDIEVKE